MQKTKASLGIWTTLCAVFMVGCQPTGAPTLATASPLALSPTPTSTPTAAPTATGTPDPALPWRKECVGISTSLEIVPGGIVVIQKQGSGEISLLDFHTGGRRSFGYDTSFIMAISPDGRQLAYTSFLKGPLEIVNSDGEPIASRPLPLGWAGVVRWIDMNTLLMEKFADQVSYYRSASSIIYNFKTGAQQELSPGYDKIGAEPAYPWGNYSYTRAVYDPSLSRVVYPGLALWDLEKDRSILELHQGFEHTYSGGPQWSQDGSFFIAAAPPRLTYWAHFIRMLLTTCPTGMAMSCGVSAVTARRSG